MAKLKYTNVIANTTEQDYMFLLTSKNGENFNIDYKMPVSFETKDTRIQVRYFDIQQFKNEIPFLVDLIYKALNECDIGRANHEVNKDKIINIFENVVLWYDYNKETINLLQFFIKIFFDIFSKHKLTNGNKRVACMTLYLLLRLNSLVSPIFLQNWNRFEETLLKIIEDYQDTHNEELTLKEIYEWLI